MTDWVMVPRKITLEMANALEQSDCGPDHPIEAFWQPAWQAALAVAPQQQAEPVAFPDTGANGEPVYRPQPRLTAEQVERIKRLADELTQSVVDVAVAECAVMMVDPGIKYKRQQVDEDRAALHAALDALTKG